jgi:hypothetical protein
LTGGVGAAPATRLPRSLVAIHQSSAELETTRVKPALALRQRVLLTAVGFQQPTDPIPLTGAYCENTGDCVSLELHTKTSFGNLRWPLFRCAYARSPRKDQCASCPPACIRFTMCVHNYEHTCTSRNNKRSLCMQYPAKFSFLQCT